MNIQEEKQMVSELPTTLTRLLATLDTKAAVVHSIKYPNLDRSAVAEYLFREDMRGLAEQITAGVQVPIVLPNIKLHERQTFIVGYMAATWIAHVAS